MGGKAKGSNDQMIAFQKEQAAESRMKEEQRKARLEQGKGAIDQLFAPSGFAPIYDRYQKASLDYTLPQLQDQYDEQRRQLTFALARAGTSNSTIAADKLADVEKQRITKEGELRAQAESDLSNFKNAMQSQQQSALSQLYATEDPDVAANTATHMVANAQLAQPNLNPLGELFKPLIIGTTTGIGSFLDAQNFKNYFGTAQKPKVQFSGQNQ